MIDLRTLEIIYWVARLGGFGRAATRLHTTQPAISARIAQLEAAYGVRLFDRTVRSRATLTPKGAELVAHAERMLALHGDLVAALGSGEFQGTVRLGVSETLVHTWLSRLVSRVHATYPRVVIDITVDVSVNLRAAVLVGEIDVALLLGPIAAPRVTDRPLGAHPLAWCASPALALGPGPIDLAWLARWPIVTFPRATPVFQDVSAMFARAGLPARIFACSALSSIVRMGVDGIGICVIPPAVIAVELASGALRILDAEPALAPLVFTASFLQAPDTALVAAVAELAVQVAAS